MKKTTKIGRQKYSLREVPLYDQLYEIVKEKEYFVLTANVDHQFRKAGFHEEHIFATQGDYGRVFGMNGTEKVSM